MPSEPPVIWCNAPDCWTVCAYGSRPTVYRGLKAWIADFFFTPVHRNDDVRQAYLDQPSIQRYQTFSEFNKLRYKGSLSSPSVPQMPSKSSPSGYFTDNQAVLDIRPEKPIKAYQGLSGLRMTDPINAKSVNEASSSSSRSNQNAQPIATRHEYSANIESDPRSGAYPSSYEAKTLSSNAPLATEISYSYPSPYTQTPSGVKYQDSHRQYPFISPTEFESQIRYPCPSADTSETYPRTRKSDPTYSIPFSTPFQELYSNYPGPLTPKYNNGISHFPGPQPSEGIRSGYPYSSHPPLSSPKPEAYSVPKVKKPSPTRLQEAKPKPAYSEYSPDVQALLGTQAAARYSRYSPYSIARKL
ncbi:hypothetical protein ACEPAH_7806 [Sanghuangporus vaninii]